ncbi:MAG: hypothetical protein KBT27_10450 [Prevotellaceae bacterium]|nr:hypothetical protein [Candidatus Faecinaster equi]
MVDREELVGYITNHHPCERNMCPSSGMCRDCAEKQLAEYEDGIRAELYDEVMDEVYQRLNSVLDDEKRKSEAEAIDKFVKIFKAKTTMEHKLVDDIAEQLKEHIWS